MLKRIKPNQPLKSARRQPCGFVDNAPRYPQPHRAINNRSGHIMCYENRTSLRASDTRWTTGHPLSGDAAIRDCVLLALEAVKRGDRAEDLVLGDDAAFATEGCKFRSIGSQRAERPSCRSAPSARKSCRPCAARLPPVTTLSPFFTASAICASTFSTAFMSINGPITPKRRVPAQFEREFLDRLGALLHQQICPPRSSR